MLPPLIGLLRMYAPVITLPFAAIVGYIGYHIENRFRKEKNPPYHGSVLEKRMQNWDESGKITEESLKLVDKSFVPKTIFEKNLSPSLQETEETK